MDVVFSLMKYREVESMAESEIHNPLSMGVDMDNLKVGFEAWFVERVGLPDWRIDPLTDLSHVKNEVLLKLLKRKFLIRDIQFSSASWIMLGSGWWNSIALLRMKYQCQVMAFSLKAYLELLSQRFYLAVESTRLVLLVRNGEVSHPLLVSFPTMKEKGGHIRTPF